MCGASVTLCCDCASDHKLKNPGRPVCARPSGNLAHIETPVLMPPSSRLHVDLARNDIHHGNVATLSLFVQDPHLYHGNYAHH